MRRRVEEEEVGENWRRRLLRLEEGGEEKVVEDLKLRLLRLRLRLRFREMDEVHEEANTVISIDLLVIVDMISSATTSKYAIKHNPLTYSQLMERSVPLFSIEEKKISSNNVKSGFLSNRSSKVVIEGLI
ncbi:hypothetical protein KSS87_020416 [Heliosperma pusillum]|nr:hypothetical protein KSS87_023363 [Heliosperma pusillum]KAH9611609.1 hypothetical protein KSS87_007792 [Heliosperma pusillum]KAH9620463.1 hypothetical protein KSS87_020416 [Heliosperma pusillum]